jgi:hypothetical protein
LYIFHSFSNKNHFGILLLLNQQNLSTEQMRAVMRQIMTGSVTDAQLAAFVIALRCKGESVDEIAAASEGGMHVVLLDRDNVTGGKAPYPVAYSFDDILQDTTVDA